MKCERAAQILVLAMAITTLLVLYSGSALAACRVGGYTYNANNQPEASFVQGLCENTGELLSFNKPPGHLWLFSYGGPFETCEGRCGNVFINATNKELGVYGFTVNNPLNSSNTIGWGLPKTHAYNITMNKAFITEIAEKKQQELNKEEQPDAVVLEDKKSDRALQHGGVGNKNVEDTSEEDTIYETQGKAYASPKWVILLFVALIVFLLWRYVERGVRKGL